MHILTLVSAKGGVGKTMLAAHLAVRADQRGYGPAAVVDFDPEGDLGGWWNARTASSPQLVHAAAPNVAEVLKPLRGLGIEFLVIDTPASADDVVRDVVSLSDLVVIPIQARALDLETVSATAQMVARSGKPLIFVVNDAARNQRLTNQDVAVLSEHGPLAPTTVHHRAQFASSMKKGRTVMDAAKANRASNEIAQLWDYVKRHLDGRTVSRDLPGLYR